MFAINAMCPEVIGYREHYIHKLREVVSVRNMVHLRATVYVRGSISLVLGGIPGCWLQCSEKYKCWRQTSQLVVPLFLGVATSQLKSRSDLIAKLLMEPLRWLYSLLRRICS